GSQVVTITPPPKLVFTTAPQSTTVNKSTGLITVQRQTAAGQAITTGSITVNLATTAGGGTFRNSGDTAAITSITIGANARSATSVYRDTAAGTPTITASPPNTTSGTQTVTVTAPPKLVFTTSAQTTTQGVSTGVITVQRQSFGGTAQTANSLMVNLT